MPEELFEYIVFCGKREYCLTENQHEELLRCQNNKLVRFDFGTINPSYVSSTAKQPAKQLKKIYPCKSCNATGSIYKQEMEIVKQSECGICKGTGVDTSEKPRIEFLLEDKNGEI